MLRISKTKVITEPVRRLAAQIIEREPYEIIRGLGITKEELANAAASMAYHLAYIDYDTDRLRFHARRVAKLTALGLDWQICTDPSGSWLSATENGSTAMVNAMAGIFSDPYAIYEDEVETLLDMINSAWFRLDSIKQAKP